jgi:hypothetical protein
MQSGVGNPNLLVAALPLVIASLRALAHIRRTASRATLDGSGIPSMFPSQQSSPALQQFLARCAAVVRSHRPPINDDGAAMDIWEGEGGSTEPLAGHAPVMDRVFHALDGGAYRRR